MSDSTRTWIAEVLGTFTLVFVGGLSAVVALNVGGGSLTPGGVVIIALGFGLGLLAGLYAFGEVSGGHYNPAVSLAALIDKRIDVNTFIQYVVSQAGGAAIAAVALIAATDADSIGANLTTHPGGAVTSFGGFVLEILLTAVFVAVILKVTTSDDFGSTALVAIPLSLVAIHAAAVPLTGASVNPARSLGPALVGGNYDDFWIYVTAPFIGAALGWVVYKAVTTETGEKELV